MIERTINLTSCNNSFFLLGPRQVGKTSLIKATLQYDVYINLILHSEYLRYAKNPSILSAEIKTLSKKGKIKIVVDEVQRCPDLLNEAQALIDDLDVQFIFSGSSARKLKRTGANLLGGRALTFHLHPFTYEELGEKFVLDDALQFGTLPRVALANSQREKTLFLRAYIETYLKEEIQQEALTRNVPAFSRFLELAAFENGNILNFNNISREVGVSSKAIKEYFQILEDTLIGFFLYPYAKSHRQRLIAHPKFYFFDCGVVSALKNQIQAGIVKGTYPYGMMFEHFILLETRRLIDYRGREVKTTFFRTSDGGEVDLILEFANSLWAVEIKSGTEPTSSDISGLKSFIKDHNFDRAICVCQTPRPYKIGKVEFLPWQDFMKQL